MIYLDNAATSFPKPDRVYEAMDRFARSALGNPGRAGHKMAISSERVLDSARHLLNQFFGGEGPERFVFTLNCTDALNMAIKGVLRDGDHVVTSDLEHNSVSRPLAALERAGRISLTRVKAKSEGFIDPDDVRAAMTSQTRLVVLTHASNVLGTVQRIEPVGRMVRERDCLFLVDAAQSAGVVPLNIEQMSIDLLAFPGHKSLLGPTGTGALYVGPRARLRAWREGGSGGDSSSATQPAELPYWLEGGTANVQGIVGLSEGLNYIQATGIELIRDHELDLVERVVHWAEDSPHYVVYGKFNRATHAATVSLGVHGVAPSEIGAILDSAYDIAVRPGLHCAPYIHRALGTFPDGTVRVSPGPFSTVDDIQTLCDALKDISDELAGVLGHGSGIRENSRR